jgi:hypothetical protein
MLFRGMKNRLDTIHGRKIGKIIITLVTVSVFLHQSNIFLIHSVKDNVVILPILVSF